MDTLQIIHTKKLALITALLGAAVLLGGCASSAGLSTQGRLATPAALAAGKSLTGTDGKSAGAWPALDWWRALGDAQLDALIEEALQGNPDLAAADARVRQAGAMALNVDAAHAPTLNAQGSLQTIHIPGKVLSATSPDMSSTMRMLSLNASHKVDLWGGERAAWESALGQQRASEVDAQAARLTLSVDVARAYARLAHAWQTHDLTQKEVERTQQLLDLTLQRVKAGIDGIGQQRQTEALAAATRRQLAQSAHTIDSGKITLAILIGKGPARATEIARPRALQPLALAIPGNLPANLLGRRPDIVAARWRVEAAQHTIDASKADFYPSFNLTAAFGLLALNTADLPSLRSRYYTASPAISLPIFDGGRLRATLAGHHADYDIAIARYNKTLVGALNDVALQIQTAQALTTQETVQQQAVSAAREAWELAMQRYRRGISGYGEALTTQQSVLAAETALAAIHAQRIDSAIQLVHALGGGYATQAPGNATPSMTQNMTGNI